MTDDDVLLEAVVDISSGLDLGETLRRILRSAIKVSQAKYGALGVTNMSGSLVTFLHEGLEPQKVTQIERLPQGAGLLGELVRRHEPLRLADLTEHPASAGFPSGHPPMTSFLGVPLRHGGEALGNLYLTDKKGGFTADDERRVVGLAAAAGVSIRNARLFQALRTRQRWQAAAGDMAVMVLSGEDVGTILQQAAHAAADIVTAQGSFVTLPEDDGYVVEVVHVTDSANPLDEPGRGLSLGDHLSGEAAVFLAEADNGAIQQMRTQVSSGGELFVFEWAATLPFRYRENQLGALTLLFEEHNAPLASTTALRSFGDQAAAILALEQERRIAEQVQVYSERDRIARDLHDSVSQRLFAAGMTLQAALAKHQGGGVPTETVENVIEEMNGVISDIRDTIHDLRDHTDRLDELLAAEVARAEGPLGFRADLDVQTGLTEPPADVVTTMGLVVREGLANIAKHAEASWAQVRVQHNDDGLCVQIEDNGLGEDQSEGRRSGLRNLLDRAAALGGHAEILFLGPGVGSRLIWRVPFQPRE